MASRRKHLCVGWAMGCIIGRPSMGRICARIHERMAKWDNSELVILKDGRHEVLMEVKALRDRVFDGAVALFDAQLAAAT